MAGEGYSNSAPAAEVALDANGLRLDGPTIETYVKAGYPAGHYPPAGWAEQPSPGLDAYRAYQADPHNAVKHATAATALGLSVGEVTHGRLEPVAPAPPPSPAVDSNRAPADNQPLDSNATATADDDGLVPLPDDDE